MVTKRLFWDDCYVHEFNAKITEIGDNYIVLDGTFFYPQGGGQPGDTGTIGNTQITDTRKNENLIFHYFEGNCSLIVGDMVDCKLDWERRYNLMKAHSASHIVEHFLFAICGKIESEGSFLSENKDKSTYITDFSFTPEILKRIEDAANQFIASNHEIVLSTDPSDENVRVWVCAGIVYHCGGMHPHKTTEIGSISIKRKSGGRGKQKIITEVVG